MRKSPEAPRFPQSAALFKFCLEALQATKGGRIHDQEVGNILGYNPSDTSHWKRGKKAVRNIHALEKLAQTVGTSSELIQDLADGLLSFDDAWFEFEELIEIRRLNASMTPELQVERQKRLQAIEQVAASILAKARIQSLPVFLPEIIELFPYIKVVSGELTGRLARSLRGKPGSFQIKHRKGEMNAHTRLALAREVARLILLCERDNLGLPAKHDGLETAEVFALSHALLIPRDLLRAEMQRQPMRVDMIGTLSEAFWVPRASIRSRIKEIILENLTRDELVREPLSVRTTDGAQRRPALFTGTGSMATDDLSEDGAPSTVGTVSAPTGTLDPANPTTLH
jgi:hypothetical protein